MNLLKTSCNVCLDVWIIYIVISDSQHDILERVAAASDGFSLGAICRVSPALTPQHHLYEFFKDASKFMQSNSSKPSWRLALKFSFAEFDRVRSEATVSELNTIRNQLQKIKLFSETTHSSLFLRQLYFKYIHWARKL